jgi:hypothetical protein
MMEVSEQDIVLENGHAKVAGSEMSRSFREIAARSWGMPGFSMAGGPPPGLEAASHFTPDQSTYSNGTHIAEVEVDIETGHVKILRYVVMHDCGHVINPMVVEGQGSAVSYTASATRSSSTCATATTRTRCRRISANSRCRTDLPTWKSAHGNVVAVEPAHQRRGRAAPSRLPRRPWRSRMRWSRSGVIAEAPITPQRASWNCWDAALMPDPLKPGAM